MKTNVVAKVLPIVLIFSLSACGSNPTKQGEDSDARKLIDLYQFNIDQHAIDGSSAETAKVGVDRSLQQEFNGSFGRHFVNYAFGGIGGLISLGVLQSSSNDFYEQQKNVLDNPSILYYVPKSHGDANYKVVAESIRAAYKENGYELHDWEYGKFFVDGKECSLKTQNCVLKPYFYNYFKKRGFMSIYSNTPRLDEFPNIFQPENKTNDEYHLYAIAYRQFYDSNGNEKGGLQLANTSKVMESYQRILNSRLKAQNYTFNLYIPGYMNQGKPMIINSKGQESFFVRKS